MCSDGWNLGNPDGECLECGIETVDGGAAYSCNWSPLDCETCGSRPCDGSC